jgi:pyruvate dehydrogenase E1 component
MHQKITERNVDLDPRETAEWLEALDEIVDAVGPERATYLLDKLTERARSVGVEIPVQLNTPYVNTIPVDAEVPYPGDRALERRIKSLVRWNAMAMVTHQNKYDAGIGGHISTSSTPAMATNRATSFIFRATLRPGFMDAHSSKAV